MRKKAYTSQRIKIGKSFFTPVLLKVVATNPDGSPRWLEIMRDDEKANIEHGSREFYLVWGSEMLAARAKQDGKDAAGQTAEIKRTIGAAGMVGHVDMEVPPAITTAPPAPSPGGELTLTANGETIAVVPVAEGESQDDVAARVLAAIQAQPVPKLDDLIDDESLCAVCGWRLHERADEGCVRGNCSLRPRPVNLYAPVRASKEAAEAMRRASEAMQQ